MPRKANPPEERVLRALRQANVITGPQFDDALARLEATEACDKCGGTGRQPEWPGGGGVGVGGETFPCTKCDGTGQMRAIR